MNACLLSWIRCSIVLAATFLMTSVASGQHKSRLVALGYNTFPLFPFPPAGLIEIDKESGDLTPTGDLLNLETDIGRNLAADSQGRLYNLFSRYVNGILDTEGWINEIGPATGQVIRRIPFEESDQYVPFVASDVAFDSEDRLYAVLLHSNPVIDAPPFLGEIDPVTGELLRSVSVGHEYSGLAFDVEDNLYGAARGAGLVRIDPVTGDETVLGGGLADYGPSLPIVDISLAFDRDGTLYAAADRLLRVDPATGATSPVGSATFGSFQMFGLTVVPEPGAAVLVVIVAMGWLVHRFCGRGS